MWSIPMFGDKNLFEWQTGRMRNYMTNIINNPVKPYTPRHYRPEIGKIITTDHLACFYGVSLAKMFSVNPSAKQMLSTCDMFDADEPVKESMTLDCFKDLTRFLHFSDD